MLILSLPNGFMVLNIELLGVLERVQREENINVWLSFSLPLVHGIIVGKVLRILEIQSFYH